MRKHLLTAFLAAMDGLIAILFGLEAFIAATVALGLACAYAYRAEIHSAGRAVLDKSKRPPPGVGELDSALIAGEGVFERNPGRGDAAARLIECAPGFEEAVSIFRDFRLAPLTVQEDSVGSAMVDRLRREGPTNDTLKFLSEEGCLERRRQEGEEIDEGSYEWVVMIFEDKVRKARGNDDGKPASR